MMESKEFSTLGNRISRRLQPSRKLTSLRAVNKSDLGSISLRALEAGDLEQVLHWAMPRNFPGRLLTPAGLPAEETRLLRLLPDPIA